MLRQERVNDIEEVLRLAMDGMQAQLWTALPGIVQSFDPVKLTVVVQPSIKGRQRMQDGTIKDVTLPLLPDVPVVAPRGGSCTLTFPIKQGDECLVVFANRCIDLWWQSGGVQPQATTDSTGKIATGELRMHDLSDGFALIGPFSQKTKIANWSTTEVELRSDDRQAFFAINPTTHDVTCETTGNVIVSSQKDITITAAGNISLTAAQINLNP